MLALMEVRVAPKTAEVLCAPGSDVRARTALRSIRFALQPATPSLSVRTTPALGPAIKRGLGLAVT
eukprot:scaffold26207_cov48-Phaeocystis_antarctica.AAC.2